MRELTFKGYLLFQLKKLSGCNTTSLYMFSNLASSNARLQDALTMYLVLYTKEDLKNYKTFKKILITFKNFYKIDEYDLKEIDKYIWQLGKEYFPKKILSIL